GAALHLHDVLGLERAAAREQGDLVLAEEELDALGHPVGHAAAALHGLGIARLEPTELDAEVRGVTHQVDALGIAQQRLGGDATPVQAHAAGPIVFHRGDREAELGAADRRDVAARSGADHHDVELVAGHRARRAGAAALPAAA